MHTVASTSRVSNSLASAPLATDASSCPTLPPVQVTSCCHSAAAPTPAGEAADREARLAAAVEKVAGWFAHLVDPDQVVELRAPNVQAGDGEGTDRRTTFYGRFRGAEASELARETLRLSGICTGVYFTLNALKPELLRRGSGCTLRPDSRMLPARRKGSTAADSDATERRRILIDIDPVRAGGAKGPATDAEHAAALATADRVREYLTRCGWTEPVVVDGGNGAALYYKVSLPAECDDVRRVLHHLAEKFDGPGGTVDTSVYNPARIARAPGAMNQKGVESEGRRYRRCRCSRRRRADCRSSPPSGSPRSPPCGSRRPRLVPPPPPPPRPPRTLPPGPALRDPPP